MKKQQNSHRTALYEAIVCSLFASIICVAAPISIPVGPIPITLGFFAIFLAGIVLSPKSAAAAVSIYIALGAVGLPVFSGARQGFSVLLGPTGGYLWGYLPMVVIISLFIKIFCRNISGKILSAILYVLACICGGLICYATGTIQYMFVTGVPLKEALSLCVLPFIPFDILKAVFASSLGVAVRPVVLSLVQSKSPKCM